MALSGAVQRMLRASVAARVDGQEVRRDLGRLDARGLTELALAARFHGIAGYVWEAIEAGGGITGVDGADMRDPMVAARGDGAGTGGPGTGIAERNGHGGDASAALRVLREGPMRTLATHLRTLGDLGVLAEALDGADVPWLVVKGPVLAEHAHSSPTLRGYSDLDVLVTPERLGTALEALEAAGCVAVDRNWLLLHRELKGELRLQLPHGTMLDLHWHLLNAREVRGAFRLRTGELLDRRRSVLVGGRQVPTLDAASTLVYVALHAVLSGLFRLIWLKDVERCAADPALDWPEALDRARAWRTDLPLAVALDRTGAALAWNPPGAAPPASRVWRALCAGAARLSPVEASDGGGSVLRLVTRSTRAGLAGSVAECGRRSTAFLSGRRDAERPRGPDGRLDPSHPGSGQHDAGGASARRAFIEAVAHAER